ncbi:MAG: 1-deoxy-D-xylulose-5-phosphate reductoisomerase [Campylobacteraceae bacterium 4484_166]|nr:MAG: 1-deoxy-D-xylulose-5-phosphate reductoisomerase [Campylobacteraceae bacterium 4484_166]
MIILGCTGSIGVSTINIVLKYNLYVDVLVAGKNIKLLNSQIKKVKPKVVVIASKEDIHKVDFDKVYAGKKAMLEAIKNSPSTLVINGLVGFVGLAPTILAISLKKHIALANKESLVVAGKFIDSSYITPIDSEHFSLSYIINRNKKINKLIITASGGSFRDIDIDNLKDVSIKEALDHPNWSMGDKITIDSATMTNKLFELLEAYWLFDIKDIDAIIERKSIIHAIVSYVDGSMVAHMSKPTMNLPIYYAIFGNTDRKISEHIDLVKLSNLSFTAIDTKRYPIWSIREKLLSNPDLGVVLNASNEVAVNMFLNNQIKFVDISKIVLHSIEKYQDISIDSLDEVYKIHQNITDDLISKKG